MTGDKKKDIKMDKKDQPEKSTRKYTMSDMAKAAREKNSKKLRPGRKSLTKKWINIRVPVEFYKKHKRDDEAFHITIRRKIAGKRKRKKPAGTTPLAEKDKRPWKPLILLIRAPPLTNGKYYIKNTQQNQGEIMLFDITTTSFKIEIEKELLQELRRAAKSRKTPLRKLIPSILTQWVKNQSWFIHTLIHIL